MRVLFLGDAVVSSGFSRCTHAACDALQRDGHDVHLLGINYQGDPHDYPYRIYPCKNHLDGGYDAYGLGRLPIMINRLKPDVVAILQDPWNIKPYTDAVKSMCQDPPPIVGWLAVDGTNQKGFELNDLSHVSCWTKFGVDELRKGGYEGDHSIVPLGVDLDVFKRVVDVEQARAIALPGISLPKDTFIVGAVGRNQPRKRLDLTIQYFAHWIGTRGIDNAILYLHIAPTGDIGVDLRSLISYYGLSGKVVIAEADMGFGRTNQAMAGVYSSFDVYVTTTQGEGWGLPCLEAMACEVPCIVPRWSGLADWTKDAAVKVPCSSTVMTAPMNGLMHTIGGVPDREEFVGALDDMYNAPRHRRAIAKRGRRLAETLPWSATGAAFVDVLVDVVRIADERASTGSLDDRMQSITSDRDEEPSARSVPHQG